MRLCLLPLTVFFLFFTSLRNLPAADAAAPAAKIKVTIGKDTTYITEPLRPDGYPDYVAAINEIYSPSVTPENNAAVLLVKAFGPDDISKRMQPNFFKQLRVIAPSEGGNYFVHQEAVVSRWAKGSSDDVRESISDALDAQFDQAQVHPWAVGDYPIVAEWLKLNEKPLRLVVEASRRPKEFLPLLAGGDEPICTSPVPYARANRQSAVALSAQAMLLVGEGKEGDAWQDLLACHRLARLTAQGAFLVDLLMGYEMERFAIAGGVALLHATKPSAKAIGQMQADLNALPLMPDSIQPINIGERFMYLDAVTYVVRGCPLSAIIRGEKASAQLPKSIDDTSIDWNVALVNGNHWYDRIVAISRMMDSSKRRTDEQMLDDELISLTKTVNEPDWLTQAFTMKATDNSMVGSRFGELLTVQLVPGIKGAANAQRRTELLGQMDQTAFALAAYRADHGQYPEELEALVPKYLAKVPKDTFAGDADLPIRYRHEGAAYVMWSVGINGVDDGGRTGDDQPPGDDWVLRPIPLEKKSSDAKR